MTATDQLRPAPAVEGLALRRIADPAELHRGRVRELHDRIAEPHHWSSLAWSDQRWRERLAAPHQRLWEVVVDDRGIGLGWLDLRDPAGGVEVAMYGLVPEAVGRGFGGAALTLLVDEAWHWLDEVTTAAASGEAAPRRRVWLHTSSLDHPHALANYLARGFVIYDTRQDTKTLPVR